MSDLLVEACAVGVRDGHLAKRQCARFAHNARMEISLTERPEKLIQGSLHNISATGLAIRCRQQIAVGTRIRIRRWSPEHRYDWVSAIVRHASRGVSRYLIGFEFTDPIGVVHSEPTIAEVPEDVSAAVVTDSRNGSVIPWFLSGLGVLALIGWAIYR